MLTGMLSPTSGYARVAGYDVRSQMALVREKIGICLQHDCLFPMLTVKEHIEFFARLKGMYDSLSKKDADASVRASIEDVALLDKRNTLSKDLSGGMKRKLSVAIAFCGNSKTVILDEPSSGMDPFSRRFVWNLIRQYRESRCIVLTTVSKTFTLTFARLQLALLLASSLQASWQPPVLGNDPTNPHEFILSFSYHSPCP